MQNIAGCQLCKDLMVYSKTEEINRISVLEDIIAAKPQHVYLKHATCLTFTSLTAKLQKVK